MDSGVLVVVFVLFGALAIGIGVLGYLAAKKRREALAALAPQRTVHGPPLVP